MSYIHSINHLENFIKRIVFENPEKIDPDKLLTLEMYWELDGKQLLDKFTWAVRNDPTILHQKNYLEWLRSASISEGVLKEYELKNLSKEFIDKVEDLNGLPGVYTFFDENDICLYVGVSINLRTRVISSYSQRFVNFNKPVWFRYCVTKTRSDAQVLESILISKLKPVLNVTGKYDDSLTFQCETPELSHKIHCNGAENE